MAVNVVGQEIITVDGFWYEILNDEEVSVTHLNSDNDSYSSPYSGNVVIPATIQYEGTTYSVVTIGKNAFNKSYVTSVSIPNTVKTIEYRAFTVTPKLTSITIPSSVISIATNSFASSGVASIAVEEGNPVYDSRNNCNAIIETATNTLVQGCKNTVIPNDIVSIGDYAFFQMGLTTINLPNSIQNIGYVAFSNNDKLSIITLPENLITIGISAFNNSSITSITIPATVTSIGSNPFSFCSNLVSIKVAEGNPVYDSRNNCNAIIETSSNTLVQGCKNTIIPNTITSIGDHAFYGSPIVSINIPNSVVEIGPSAFQRCSQLLSISIPDGVTSIGVHAFSGCSKLTSINFPYSLTTIGGEAFMGTSLTSIIIPKSVTSIGSNAFLLSTLTSIQVEEGNPKYDSRNNCNAYIVTATNKLIRGCHNTIIPNSVTSIEAQAFDCPNMTSILLPENLVSAGNSAFGGCSKITQVISCAKNPPDIWGNAFPNYSATLYVLCDSYEAYKNHEIWGQFENIECRSLNALDIEDIAINDGEALPIIDLSEYFSSDDGEIKFSAKSSDNRVVYPVVMGNKLGFIQYGTGTAEIIVTATVEPLSRSRSFTVSINTETPPQECELTLSAKITQPKCYGGEDGKIAVSVSGGTEPYYYKWNNGRTDGTLSGVSAGTYSVLVADENGCTAEKSFTITETDSIAITEKLTKPTCRKSNGKITLNITGGTEPYTYLWNLPKNRIDVAKDLENLQSESYIITVTDKNSCKASKTINLPDNGAPTVKLKSVEPSKCLEATGSIEVEVSGGSSYSWSDSSNVNSLIRPKLFPGNYTFKVNDNNGCRATMLVTVPMQQFRQPEISLVSYGDTAGHNLVIWQKEQTDEIEKYFVFRESNQAGDYDRIGSLAYNETSIYVDETANFNATSCRYRISAANQCGESQLSYAYRTMRLQRKRVDGGLLLWWNSYEGFEFVKYTLYRLTNEGLEKYAELPANKYRYVVKELDPNTIGFFVTVELTEIVDVNKPMKAEGGPFAIAFSNLAEVENADAIDEVEENQAVVYSKDKKITVTNAQNKNIFVCDVTGKIVAQQKNVETAEIPVKTAGVYVVIVGKNVFKVIVE